MYVQEECVCARMSRKVHVCAGVYVSVQSSVCAHVHERVSVHVQ